MMRFKPNWRLSAIFAVFTLVLAMVVVGSGLALSSWGNNRSTWQTIFSGITAIAIAAAFVSAFFGWRSSRISTREFQLRLRPWVSLASATFEDDHVLSLNFMNIGSMPARNPKILTRVQEMKDQDLRRLAMELPLAAASTYSAAVIFPGKSTLHQMDLTSPPYAVWKASRRSLVLFGKLWYEFDKNNSEFITTFRVGIKFDCTGEPYTEMGIEMEAN